MSILLSTLYLVYLAQGPDSQYSINVHFLKLMSEWSNKGRKNIERNKIFFTYWCVLKVDFTFYLLEIIKE